MPFIKDPMEVDIMDEFKPQPYLQRWHTMDHKGEMGENKKDRSG